MGSVLESCRDADALCCDIKTLQLLQGSVHGTVCRSVRQEARC